MPHGCVALVHGMLRDLGAMSAPKAIRVDVCNLREVLTVECACVRLGLTVIGALKMPKYVDRVQSVLYC